MQQCLSVESLSSHTCGGRLIVGDSDRYSDYSDVINSGMCHQYWWYTHWWDVRPIEMPTTQYVAIRWTYFMYVRGGEDTLFHVMLCIVCFDMRRIAIWCRNNNCTNEIIRNYKNKNNKMHGWK